MKGNLLHGANYLLRGFSLMMRPGLRLFVIVPLLINCGVFTLLIYITINQFNHWLNQLAAWLPQWLDWLQWLLWPLILLLLIIVVMQSFSIIANIIASPFNGLLAEKTEELVTGKPVNSSETLWQTLKDTPRAMAKEVQKLLYYLPRAIGLGLLSLILLFIFPPIITFLWFLLGAWMLALQYCDYPMENRRFSLLRVRQRISREKLTSFGFGGAIQLAAMIPFINLVIMPAAVCGAVLYWTERMNENTAPPESIAH